LLYQLSYLAFYCCVEKGVLNQKHPFYASLPAPLFPDKRLTVCFESD
jgi:hypothetical protein